MKLKLFLSVVLVCMAACVSLGRISRWYLAAWLPLLIFSLLGALGLAAVGFEPVNGGGAGAGFAQLGKAYAMGCLLPSIFFLPILWLARPRVHTDPGLGPLMLGMLIPAATFFAAGITIYDNIPIRVMDAQGRQVSHQYICQQEAMHGVSKDGPTATTDMDGLAEIQSLDWQKSTFRTVQSDGYAVEVKWGQGTGGRDIWHYRWEGPMYFGMELPASSAASPVIDFYLRRWNELEMPILVQRIRQMMDEAKASNTASLTNYGSSPESLSFIQELADLSQKHPAQRPIISKIFTGQAAMLASFSAIVKSTNKGDHKHRSSTGLQALVIWATQKDQVSPEAIRALELKLGHIGRQTLDAALPLIGDRESSYQAFSHLKDLAVPYIPQILARFPHAEENGKIMMTHLFRELDLGFTRLKLLADSESPEHCVSILNAVNDWQNKEELKEALALLDAKEREYQTTKHFNQLYGINRFSYLREKLQRTEASLR